MIIFLCMNSFCNEVTLLHQCISDTVEMMVFNVERISTFGFFSIS
jgi:hypothetical protein